MHAQAAAQFAAGHVDGVRIHVLANLAGDVGLGGQADRLGGEGGVGGEEVERAAQSLRKAGVLRGQAASADGCDGGCQQTGRQCLDRLPAVEEIAAIASGLKAFKASLDNLLTWFELKRAT